MLSRPDSFFPHAALVEHFLFINFYFRQHGMKKGRGRGKEIQSATNNASLNAKVARCQVIGMQAFGNIEWYSPIVAKRFRTICCVAVRRYYLVRQGITVKLPHGGRTIVGGKIPNRALVNQPTDLRLV